MLRRIQSLIAEVASFFPTFNHMFIEEPEHAQLTVDFYQTEEVEPITEHPNHDILITKEGKLFFHLYGRWCLQGHVDDLFVSNLLTADEMTPKDQKREADDHSYMLRQVMR